MCWPKPGCKGSIGEVMAGTRFGNVLGNVMKPGLVIDPVEVVGQWSNRWAGNWLGLTWSILKNLKLYMYLLYISI